MFDNGRRRCGAFTLIELLTVCAIILVLAGIVTPVLMYAKASAKSGACLSNSAQLSKSMLLYMDDNGGSLARESLDEHYWLDQLKPYGVTETSVKCPEFSPIPEVGRGSGWSLNVCLSSESIVSSTASTVMFTETTEGIATAPGKPKMILWPKLVSAPDWFLYNNPGLTAGETYTMGQPFGAKRHFGRSNYALADGHSASFPPGGIRLPANLSCQGGPDQWMGPVSGPTFRVR